MTLPIAMSQQLGTQHHNDLLAASGRWRAAREARLARPRRFAKFGRGNRQPHPATPPVTLVSASTPVRATPATVAPESSAMEVRRPLVRS